MTAHGRLMLTVLGGLAEFERELIRARTSEGRARAKANGKSLGRPAGNQVMSTASEPLPSHLRPPVTVEIPITWTPEQALAVFELLNDLSEKIWELYNVQLQDLLREQQQSAGHSAEPGVHGHRAGAAAH